MHAIEETQQAVFHVQQQIRLAKARLGREVALLQTNRPRKLAADRGILLVHTRPAALLKEENLRPDRFWSVYRLPRGTCTLVLREAAERHFE